MKKKIILLSLMLSLLPCTSFISANQYITQEKTELDNKLRQRGVKRANSGVSDELSIETTNVDYDLRWIYGGEKGYRTYDISKLFPNSNSDKDMNFKFICAKPVNENLYLYVYTNDNRNGDILSANVRLSLSKSLDSKTGEFVENYSSYNARFVNSYGFKQRFMKFCIDGLFNNDVDFRCYIDTINIRYNDSYGNPYYSGNKKVQDEFAFTADETQDFTYEYFKNEYVKITDGEVDLLLIQSDRNGVFENLANAYNEDFYYFFTSDHDIEDLIEVQYDYQLVSYQATMKWDNNSWGALPEKGGVAYTGFLNGKKGPGKHQNNAKSIDNQNVKNYANQKLSKSSYVVEVTKPYFLWWNQEVKYKMDTIIDCLNIDSIPDTDEYKKLKTFVTDKQNERLANNKSKYEWAFQVTSTFRECLKWWNEYEWWSWLTLTIGGSSAWSTTQCHEVKQAVITWLKFRTNNQDFEFNVLDIPKDTTSVFLDTVPFETLPDQVINNVKSFGKWLSNFFTNDGWKDLLKVAAIVLLLIVGFMAIPLISSFFTVVGSVFKTATTPINNRAKKKEKKTNKKE